MIVALQGDEVDFVEHFSVSGGKALLTDPNVTVIAIRDRDAPPAPHANRQGAVHGQARAPGDRALDSTARRSSTGSVGRARPTSATTARSRRSIPPPTPSVPQREQNIDQAKQLLADAGKGDGFAVDAQHVERVRDPRSRPAREAVRGGDRGHDQPEDHRCRARTTATPCSASSPWLDSVMGITDYGHRPCRTSTSRLPLSATQGHAGTRRTSRTTSTTSSSSEYIAALDLDSQRGRRRSRSRSCCSTRRRSSSRTSTTSSRPPKPNLLNAVSAATGQFDLSKAGFTS